MQLWEEAAGLFCGGGLEQGADWQGYRAYIAMLLHAKKGRQLSELMVTIATGGYWTQERKCAANLSNSDQCE
eukprot:1238449-Pyramimonas_sp.AAC.1